MKVLKFGGTSVGSEEAIRQVAKIVIDKAQSDQIAVVVSAVGGVTDKLINIGELAQKHDTGYQTALQDLRALHLDLFEKLTGEKSSTTIDEIINELEEICRGVFLLKELTPKSSDYIVSTGERLSSFIIKEFINKSFDKITLFDSRKVIKTDKHFGHAAVDFEASTKLAQALTLNQINLFPGFIASTHNNETTTLGRGGSDYTAAIMAKLLKAGHLEIWTDVDGIMTSDPRLVKQAHFIDHISYEEALELSHFGAKVIYPPSIQPALEIGIPITIKNTFNPEHQGTEITKEWDQDKTLIRGITSIKDISLINLSGSGMIGIPSFSFRLFKTLSDNKINIILITQASSEHTITIGVAAKDAITAVECLSEEFSTEVKNSIINPIESEDELSIIALVGANMRNQVGVSGQMFNVLGRNGVSIKAIAQGSSERNISAVIVKEDLDKALNVLHESFFLSDSKRINLFIIGTGNVGKAFLSQLQGQFTYLKKHHQLNIKVIGLANSRVMTFMKDGIPLSKWEEKIGESTEKFDRNAFYQYMENYNLRNSIFIDITGSSEIASMYSDILKESVSVVTPNKIAATAPFGEYKALKQTAQRFGSQFLFETNVCAGLPVLSTLSDLIKSGDQVHSVEAVLSGTLNFLFNEYDGTEKFVEVIKKAKKMGYTEPDPRLDLFCEDVKRKILILIRESGYEHEIGEIALESFLPESCVGSTSIDDFYDKVEKEEPHFKAIYDKAKANGTQLRVVASYKDGKASVGLEEISPEHPFFYLEGSDNIVLFYTNRYKAQPLVIKGAGAGADVTASGIFADVLRIAQSDQ
ncbi:bifunctional aspartate kinase/homoserine dehydrogenase I [Marinoscillum sp. MHG1-6]|uniref:bifunctional aspartate kinase/homoserine dehydrogenase I n=1 Tax=Marinoscillum sp. MHG1-6 TaxID=2959627 RepID=UPI002157F8B0|nr:bifunctional aspartate kinase/homoserine dehydrogenase I [Marinoscillum sp. MHG1-6]